MRTMIGNVQEGDADAGLRCLVGLSGTNGVIVQGRRPSRPREWGVTPLGSSYLVPGGESFTVSGTLDDFRSRVSASLSGVGDALRASPVPSAIGLTCLVGAVAAMFWPGKRRR